MSISLQNQHTSIIKLKMERTNRPDLQSIEEEITLLAKESAHTQDPNQLWNEKGHPLQQTGQKLEIVWMVQKEIVDSQIRLS